MLVEVIGGTIAEEEKNAYVKYIQNANFGINISKLTIELDGDYVNLTYVREPQPFHRIRRITGYLTDMSRCNNAKRSEIDDRVKHNMVTQ